MFAYLFFCCLFIFPPFIAPTFKGNEKGKEFHNVEEPLKKPLINLAQVDGSRETQIINMAAIFRDVYKGRLLNEKEKKKVTTDLIDFMFYHGYQQDEIAQKRDIDYRNGARNAKKRYRRMIINIWALYENFCLFQHPGI